MMCENSRNYAMLEDGHSMLENAWIVGTTRHAYILQMLVSHEQGGLRSFLL
jgi:hypothetical protein